MTRRLIARVMTDRKRQKELLYDDKGQLVKKNHVQNLCFFIYRWVSSHTQLKNRQQTPWFHNDNRTMLSSASCKTAK